jgi:hypothetical protein
MNRVPRVRRPWTRGASQENCPRLMSRLIVGLAATALVSSGLGLAAGEGTAQAQPRVPVPADDGDWGPPRHWCPGQPVPQTGNNVTDPINWDWNVCHTYYFVWEGMGNVSNVTWDGDDPPPKPPPPIGLYCDQGTFFANCRIGDHP